MSSKLVSNQDGLTLILVMCLHEVIVEICNLNQWEFSWISSRFLYGQEVVMPMEYIVPSLRIVACT